ncbi:MAG: response regulator [Desulfobacteraceae bacterium]|nr:response regulator [Desulfobacteraceae bacterium]
MRKPKILLVDDEERFLSTTQKVLRRKGYDVLTAGSGAEALATIDRNPVDVAIVDVKMPGMDGIATLKEIKRRHPLVEVIMLTGHGTFESAVEGMKSGATDYLTKPSEIDELLEKVAEAFERRRHLEEKIRAIQNHQTPREK